MLSYLLTKEALDLNTKKYKKMKKNIFIIILMLSVSNMVFSQKESKLYPIVNKVTVFYSTAQVEKSTKLSLDKGFNEIILCGNSPYLRKQSIQFNNSSDFMITEFTPYIQTVREDKSSEDKLDKKSKDILKKLKDSLDKVDRIIYDKKTLEKVYHTELEVLEKIEFMSKKDSLLGVKRIKETLNFYRDKSIDVRSNIAKLEKETLIYQEKRRELKANIRLILQDNEEKENSNKTEYYIKLIVYAKKQVETSIEYIYNVNAISWNPFYDVKFTKSSNMANLILKTEFQQNTGEDWKDVKLVFSTHDSQEQGEPYELEPMVYTLSSYSNTLNYKGDMISGQVTDALTSQPMPFVNVIVEQNGVQKGGAQTDLDGYYKIKDLSSGYYDVIASFVGYEKTIRKGVKTIRGNTNCNIKLQQASYSLDEIVTTYCKTPTLEDEEDRDNYQGFIEEGEDFMIMDDSFSLESSSFSKPLVNNSSPTLGKEYEVGMNYTINSGERPKVIPLEEKNSPFFYKYYSIPKAEKMVYFSALIPSWVDLDLMNAKAKIYIDESFVNDSYISSNQSTDTLSLPIGKEKRLAVDRTVTFAQPEKTNRKGTILESLVTVTIIAKNNKDEFASVRIDDQIPISNIEDITIENKELSGAILDEKTGILYWDISLKALESKTLTLIYTVRYPKTAKILLN